MLLVLDCFIRKQIITYLIIINYFGQIIRQLSIRLLNQWCFVIKINLLEGGNHYSRLIQWPGRRADIPVLTFAAWEHNIIHTITIQYNSHLVYAKIQHPFYATVKPIFVFGEKLKYVVTVVYCRWSAFIHGGLCARAQSELRGLLAVDSASQPSQPVSMAFVGCIDVFDDAD